MRRTGGSTLTLLAAAALLVAALAVSSAAAAEGEGPGMRSALEYLQKLDKYYSQAARPRRYNELASALDVWRAETKRFGKRADFGAPAEDAAAYYDAELPSYYYPRKRSPSPHRFY